jgi:D-alanine-D-alanine ligase
MNVALVFNLIHYEDVPPDKLDTIAELDSEETIQSLTRALESAGHRVIPVEADRSFLQKIAKLKAEIDIVFNIAEGTRGECRESQVPVILEMLGIPYTGSGPLSLALCLDKVYTKELLIASGIPTGIYQAFDRPDEPVRPDLPFPAVVKLRNQGSSMGLSKASLVHNAGELKAQLERLYSKFGYPMFAEEYLPGREFTIPVIGNDPPQTLPIIEIAYPEDDKTKMTFFVPDEWVARKLDVTPTRQVKFVTCPADVDTTLARKLRNLAVATYTAMGCRDWCRLEIRLDRNGKPKVLELNPIAGIDPSYWLPKSANAAGMSYAQLVNGILDSAVKRNRALLERRIANAPAGD